jgi:hypothetical protein
MARQIFTLAVGTLLSVSSALGTESANLGPDSKDADALETALRKGDCDTALTLANQLKASADPRATFFVGRMAAEGVCAQADASTATQYFSRAMSLGSADAVFDYGVQVGLGAGVEQSYERAGELCRRSGTDPDGHVTGYSLGYACTVTGVASRLLRESLPPGGFLPNSGSAVVQFDPGSGQMKVLSTPHVRTSAPLTGSFVGKPAFDAKGVIAKAWTRALAEVPKPDTARLDDRTLDFTLDLAMTIEGSGAGNASAKLPGAPEGVLMPGDIHATTTGH